MCPVNIKNDENIYLFVYGTLLSNVPSRMEHFLRNNTKIIGQGYVLGRLYDLGDYPGAIYDINSKNKIYGELIELKNKHTLETIDNYEELGAQWPEPTEYMRIMVTVHLKISNKNSYKRLTAFFYNYNYPVSEWDKIDSGNYKEYVTQQTNTKKTL
ncbi:MAG: gamma-glutamylcyclotransferase [Bacteroidales bacterium]